MATLIRLLYFELYTAMDYLSTYCSRGITVSHLAFHLYSESSSQASGSPLLIRCAQEALAAFLLRLLADNRDWYCVSPLLIFCHLERNLIQIILVDRNVTFGCADKCKRLFSESVLTCYYSASCDLFQGNPCCEMQLKVGFFLSYVLTVFFYSFFIMFLDFNFIFTKYLTFESAHSTQLADSSGFMTWNNSFLSEKSWFSSERCRGLMTRQLAPWAGPTPLSLSCCCQAVHQNQGGVKTTMAAADKIDADIEAVYIVCSYFTLLHS